MMRTPEVSNIQLWIAILLTVSGIALLFSGFWVAPEGEIDNSVLIAFGEVMTFAGGLFGVDYSYRVRKQPHQPPPKGG